jgi:hypothetical protein
LILLKELCDFGGFPVKKEVPLVIADSALVKDFVSLFNKGGSTGYKGGKNPYKGGSTSNKDAEILNNGGVATFEWSSF